ncbi:hypothetical protein L204_105957 [Cryptococcus depauperatus]|nr:hypothetical protein L204_05080 [Cryptococcus depauperatus CBS 7855]
MDKRSEYWDPARRSADKSGQSQTHLESSLRDTNVASQYFANQTTLAVSQPTSASHPSTSLPVSSAADESEVDPKEAQRLRKLKANRASAKRTAERKKRHDDKTGERIAELEFLLKESEEKVKVFYAAWTLGGIKYDPEASDFKSWNSK